MLQRPRNLPLILISLDPDAIRPPVAAADFREVAENLVMKTAQDVIGKFGTPPPEICLDWAWQLHEWEDDASSDSEPLSNDESACWLDLAVDRTGRLHGAAPGPMPAEKVRAAINQLLAWAAESCEVRPDLGQANAFQTQSTTDILWRQTLRLQKSIDVARPARVKTENSLPAQHPSPANKKPQAKRAHQARNRKGVGFRRRSIAGMILVALALIVIPTIASRYRLSSLPPRERHQDGLHEPRTNPADSLEPNSTEQLGFLETTATVVPDVPLNSGAQAPAGKTPVAEGLSVHWEDAAREQVGLKLRSSPDSKPTTESADDLSVATTEPLIGSSQTMDAPKIDVLAELQQMTHAAEREQSENLLEASTDKAVNDAATSDDSHRAPLAINLFPVTQYQRVANSLRVRKPSWEIRLQVPEALDVLPLEPLVISGRETVVWVIRKHQETSATPGTAIVVQAELANNRDASLRFRIAAGTEDLPQLAIPVDTQVLEVLQNNLRNRSGFMQLEIDRMRSLSDTQGIPSDLRKAVIAQRRGYETQLKLATKILQVVADVQHMVECLAERIEIHATLNETAVSPSTKLLQFGKTWEPSPDHGG